MNTRLRKIRKDAGMSQAEFASALGVSLTIIQAWENGRRNPSSSSLYMIADKFNVRREWLENGTEPMRFPEPDRDAEAMMVSELLEDLENPVYELVRDAMFAYIELSPEERETAKKYAASILQKAKERDCTKK